MLLEPSRACRDWRATCAGHCLPACPTGYTVDVADDTRSAWSPDVGDHCAGKPWAGQRAHAEVFAAQKASAATATAAAPAPARGLLSDGCCGGASCGRCGEKSLEDLLDLPAARGLVLRRRSGGLLLQYGGLPDGPLHGEPWALAKRLRQRRPGERVRQSFATLGRLVRWAESVSREAPVQQRLSWSS